MKIFIDSADIDEITQAFAWGVADGVTTNPSLMKKAVEKRKAAGEDLDLKSYIEEILRVAQGTPVSLEVTETSYEGMLNQAKALYNLFNPVAKNVYVKIPINAQLEDGESGHFDALRVIRALSDEKIPVNCTLVFTPEQALLAAKAGAKLISPFAGRVDDLIRKQTDASFEKTDYFPAQGDGEHEDRGVVSGVDLVAQCTQLVEHYRYECEILAASLRNTQQVREVALVGAHVATLPFGVIAQMLKHEKTFEGMKKFTADIVDEYVALTK